MKHFFYTYPIVFFLIILTTFKLHATTNHLQIAYVSINEVATKTGEQKKITRTLEKERSRIEKLIRNKSQQFKKSATKIKNEVALLSDDEKAKQYEKIQRMQIAMEQFIKQKEVEFQKKETDLKNTFITRVKNAIPIVAKTKKVSAVRNKDTTLWVDPKWDITNQVIKAYKKKYK